MNGTTSVIFNLVSLTLRSYTTLKDFMINVMFYQVKMLIFYNVQVINSIFVGKNEMYGK